MRVVRAPDGRVSLDPTGKANGRGAYVHESRVCWDDALKKDRLGRALNVAVAVEDLERLKVHAAAVASASDAGRKASYAPMDGE